MFAEGFLGDGYRPENLNATQLRGLDILWKKVVPLSMVLWALRLLPPFLEVPGAVLGLGLCGLSLFLMAKAVWLYTWVSPEYCRCRHAEGN